MCMCCSVYHALPFYNSTCHKFPRVLGMELQAACCKSEQANTQPTVSHMKKRYTCCLKENIYDTWCMKQGNKTW